MQLPIFSSSTSVNKSFFSKLTRFSSIFTIFLSANSPSFSQVDCFRNDALLLSQNSTQDSPAIAKPHAAVWKAYIEDAKEQIKGRHFAEALSLLQSALNEAVTNTPEGAAAHQEALDLINEINNLQNAKTNASSVRPSSALAKPGKNNQLQIPPLPSPEQVLLSACNKADIESTAGRYETAYGIYCSALCTNQKNLKVIDCLENRLINDNSDWPVIIIDRLIRLAIIQHDLQAAEDLAQKGLSALDIIAERMPNSEPVRIKLAYLTGDLALTYANSGKITQALALQKRSLKEMQLLLGRHNPQLTPFLRDYSSCLEKHGESVEAKNYAKQADTITRLHSHVSTDSFEAMVMRDLLNTAAASNSRIAANAPGKPNQNDSETLPSATDATTDKDKNAYAKQNARADNSHSVAGEVDDKRKSTELVRTDGTAVSESRSDDNAIGKLEEYALSLINRDRASCGLAPVALDPQLSAFARAYATDMMQHNFFSHVDPKQRGAQQRASEFGIHRPVYENIGWQSGTDTSTKKIDDLETSFMNEPANQHNHRYIILVPQHRCVGVGIARKNDELFLVHEFADESVVPSSTSDGGKIIKIVSDKDAEINDHPNVEVLTRFIRKQDPNSLSDRVRAARCQLFLQQKNYDAARADYRYLLVKDANNLPALIGLGRSCNCLGDFQTALTSFDHALALDATNTSALANRAISHWAVKNYDRALLDAKRVASLVPADDRYADLVVFIQANKSIPPSAMPAVELPGVGTMMSPVGSEHR